MDATKSPAVRNIRTDDAAELSRIDAAHTGLEKPEWWADVVKRHVRRGPEGPSRVGLVAVEHAAGRERVVGYVLGQVRAFEFGSEPCGWIYAVGVDPSRLRAGIAKELLAEATARFEEAGVKLVRTMVRRDDVPVLTLFRSEGFVGGPFVELEKPLPAARRRESP